MRDVPADLSLSGGPEGRACVAGPTSNSPALRAAAKQETMRQLLPLLCLACVAGTLRVGPRQTYRMPSAAIAAAKDGDTIEVDAGDYANDVALIDRNDLTIRGVGGTAVIRTDGRVYGRKGIWVFAEGRRGLTLENLTFKGAKVSDADGGNGAGLRSQGRDLTVRHCRFTDNQDGILGGGGTTTIERCEFDHNGPSGLTHNVYVADKAGTLVFRFNWSHDTAEGHLLKSRSAVNRIECNRLTDEAGTGSYELDLPNGGDCTVVGNLIEQSRGSRNGTVLRYGEEGVTDPARATLTVAYNTFVNDRPAGGTFVDVGGMPAGWRPTIAHNLFAGPGTAVAGAAEPDETNVVVATVAAATFADAAHFDYRPTARTPTPKAVAAVVPPPAEQYAHPCGSAARPPTTRPTAGSLVR